MKLHDNQWGFSVDESNPFRVFPLLQALSREHVQDNAVIDLSRGDPGYGYAPGERGRNFLSFLLFLDTKLNNNKRLFIERRSGAGLLDEISTLAHAHYQSKQAETNLHDLSEFIQVSQKIAKEQGHNWSPFDVLRELFKYSTISGGTYHNPQGEVLARMIIAWWHKKNVTSTFDYNDIIFTNGASHAIGTLFKLLGEEGLNYLKPGSKVLISSPVYAPYNTIMKRRGLDVINISIDPITGKIAQRSLDLLETLTDIKALLIIDPNNPSGFSMEEESMKVLSDFAEKQDSLIITDEVYSAFFEDRKSILDISPKRTIRIQARSKIERSTGLRFGDVLITPETNDYLTQHLLKDHLLDNKDFKLAFIFAKGPGGIHGEFQHTTFVPGPAQYLGAAHIILGSKDRDNYRTWMVKNRDIFCKTLGLPHKGNRYYIIFDLNKIEGSNKQDVAPEQKISELAKLGVILLPANLFFSKEDRAESSRRNMVRASLVNASPEKVKRAAQIILDYLKS
jgi:aspartate/methionine/tyrosine aminotransferase